MVTRPTCEIHDRPLVMFCPACRGAKGGAVVGPARLAQVKRIAGLGPAARWGTPKKGRNAAPHKGKQGKKPTP